MSFHILLKKIIPEGILFISLCQTSDLVLIITKRQDVILQRLSWEKVWHLGARHHLPQCSSAAQIVVTSVCWRPDGKLLALAYSTGDVNIVDINKGSIVGSIDACKENIRSLQWYSVGDEEHTSLGNYPRIIDALPTLPSLSDFRGSLKSRALSKHSTYAHIQLMSRENLANNTNSFLFVSDISHTISGYFNGDRLLISSLSRDKNYLVFALRSSTCYPGVLKSQSTMFSEIWILLNHLQDTITLFKACFLDLKEHLKQFFKPLRARIEDNGEERDMKSQFLDFLARGHSEYSVSSFIYSDIGEQGVTKWKLSFESLFEEMIQYPLLHLRLTLEKLLPWLSLLVKEKSDMLSAISAAQQLYVLSEKVSIDIQKERQSVECFFHFLQGVTHPDYSSRKATAGTLGQYNPQEILKFISNGLDVPFHLLNYFEGDELYAKQYERLENSLSYNTCTDSFSVLHTQTFPCYLNSIPDALLKADGSHLYVFQGDVDHQKSIVVTKVNVLGVEKLCISVETIVVQQVSFHSENCLMILYQDNSVSNIAIIDISSLHFFNLNQDKVQHIPLTSLLKLSTSKRLKGVWIKVASSASRNLSCVYNEQELKIIDTDYHDDDEDDDDDEDEDEDEEDVEDAAEDVFPHG